MNKLGAILYTVILLFAIVARFFDCLFTAMIESRCVSLSFFVEVFSFNFNDERHYVPIPTHWSNVKEYWNATS